MQQVPQHAEEKRPLGCLIRERMEALCRATAHLDLNAKTRSEIAFAVAEISPELEEMLSFVHKAGKGQPLTRNDLVSMQRMAYHWPQHLGDLKRYLLRAFDEIDRPAGE